MRELVESGRYDTREDFSVVLQPFFLNIRLPILEVHSLPSPSVAGRQPRQDAMRFCKPEDKMGKTELPRCSSAAPVSRTPSVLETALFPGTA